MKFFNDTEEIYTAGFDAGEDHFKHFVLQQLTIDTPNLLLMAGEMTKQEIRTVQAVLKCLRERISGEVQITE